MHFVFDHSAKNVRRLYNIVKKKKNQKTYFLAKIPNLLFKTEYKTELIEIKFKKTSRIKAYTYNVCATNKTVRVSDSESINLLILYLQSILFVFFFSIFSRTLLFLFCG